MDKKAKKILFDTLWSTAGWKDTRNISFSGENFEYAKSKGLMFEPVSMHHDECITRLKHLAEQIDIRDTASAFLSSLSTRNVYVRSAITSLTFARELELHTFSPYVSLPNHNGMSYLCGICNSHNMGGYEKYNNGDLNVLNFERIKWGGIRLSDILYCLFDLEQFEKLLQSAKPVATCEDYEILRQILKKVATIQPKDGPSQLEQALKDIFKSNKYERKVVIEILACIDILKPGSHTRSRRGGENDWVFAEDWRGEDGYNRDTATFFFGI